MHKFVEDLGGLWKRITITILCDDINQQVDKKINELSKTVRIPGFRVGKAPMSLLRQKYGTAVYHEIVNDIMKQKFVKLISENNIQLINNPVFNIIKPCSSANNEFMYSVVAETYPIIKIQGLDNITIEKPKINITDSDLNLILKSIKKKHTLWEKCNNKKIDIGDRISFSITSQENDNLIKKGIFFHDIENICMIVGDYNNSKIHDTIYKLEQDMIGRGKGDIFDMFITVPNCIDFIKFNNYEKYISMIVTIKDIEIAKYSKFNSDYFEYYNRLKIKQNIRNNLEEISKENVKTQIINKLLLINDFDLPETLIQNELNILKNRMGSIKHYIDNRLIKKSLFSLIFQEFNLEYQARRKVKIMLLLNEIIQKNQVNIDYNSISRFIEQELDSSSNFYTNKLIRSIRTDLNVKKYVTSFFLKEMALNFLIEQAKIVEKEVKLSNFLHCF